MSVRSEIQPRNLMVLNCIYLFSIKLNQFWIKIDLFWIKRSKKSIKRSKNSIKRSKNSIKRSKMLNLIKQVDLYRLDYIGSLLIIIDLFSIKFGNNIINFYKTIWIRATRSDQKCQLKGNSNPISNKFNRPSLLYCAPVCSMHAMLPNNFFPTIFSNKFVFHFSFTHLKT